MRNQRTIDKFVTCSGIGLHSGQIVNLNFLPAPVNTGVVFIRRDVNPPVFIKALAKNVLATDLSTTIGIKETVVQTVEHLLAAVM
ncbi:MAG: UDP-3-O-[3-hydroxymyristoyl] N-acetylglucosamine deacetylase, partial [Candidatus Aminicenantes bacterium]|nr:UDP-3-O-[3-hydroxymyristoyl] N-acetylglucosamine deacetylase [Candidatus Aminicenantes bacterium]NIN42578.1 UDP-3-O-[3-hydroxymyristoyl] N-acetylglucosamine deacetylase [Candidatus Aminicenantes bacterium]NIN85344.1 UDP-3-O-[3-hydroxymyristoyl] N-acetylglucosamine deacetylase [Candidatus Aminicenantes bacterium]NIR06118.1 UDP-3-O-[3-hydroxymyristoyl] N-acetylglucosamine deacetylase [Candidatus Aminicenantes bacterium]NIT23463.1 UDP-3-O-[3-hydroxymyristoyl] N-acetylglucosamine deacetylase [Ca